MNVKEHPTESIRYLKENGVVSYNLLTPVDPRSICRMCIQIKTPIDPFGKCSVRIDVNFMDEYMLGTIYDECPIEITLGVKELKAFSAFPQILQCLTSFEGITISIKDMCQKLEKYGITKTNTESVDQYLDIHKHLDNRYCNVHEMADTKTENHQIIPITGDPKKDCFIILKDE